MNINPYLIARLYTITAAFAQLGFVSSRSIQNAATTSKAPAFDWDSLLQKGEGEGEGGSGGSTAKGLRGKNHEAGKRQREAVRSGRLGRK